MPQLYANNAYGSLASSITAAATTITLASGNGARFPNPTNPDFFLLTLIGLDGNGNESSWEIVKCTARSTDSLTVTRAQEGTTAAIWAGATRVELRATAGGFGTYLVGNQTVTLSGDVTGSGATAITASISAATVTGKLITGYTAGANTALAATDTVLAALGKLQGQVTARLSANQTVTLSGDASGSGATAITVTLATVPVAKGGTGQTTVQAAINALAGGVISGQYLRGNGTNVVMSAIQAADVPTLNQNTTGTAAGLSAALVATSGGTGQTVYAIGDLLFASTTTALSKLADVATGNALISGGVGVAPSWGKIGLTTHVSGTLPVANGGTGATTLTGILKGNGTGAFTAATAGTDFPGLATANTFAGNQTIQGNLVFSGTARRITGDFDNATLANRTSFQSSTTNATTAVHAIANGTAAASYFVAFAGSDPANAAYGWLSATTTGMDIYSDKTGTGTVQPIRFLTGGTVRASVGALGGVDMATGLREARVAMGANDIDVRSGNYFTKTISIAATLTVSNVPATGTAASFILDLTNGASATITWWSGVKWAGGTAPTLTAAGRDVLGFFTHDGGTTWSGLLLGKDVK